MWGGWRGGFGGSGPRGLLVCVGVEWEGSVKCSEVRDGRGFGI
jgi:hypothetical protein